MLISWSKGAADRAGSELSEKQSVPADGALPIAPNARFQQAVIKGDKDGVWLFQITCPRPLRLWLDGQLVLNEPLFWRNFQRKMTVAVLAPAKAGESVLLAEFGERPKHGEWVEKECPSRNREAVMAAVAKRFPEVLTVKASLVPSLKLPPMSLRFTPGQFHRDGTTWQEVQARLMVNFSELPTIWARDASETSPAWPLIEAADWPGMIHESTSDADRAVGMRRLFVPVCATGSLPSLRQPGVKETRPEPECEVAAQAMLRIEGEAGETRVAFPVFESLGRLAPRREWREVTFPADAEKLLESLPDPILPAKWKHLRELYRAAWAMLIRLVRRPSIEGGLPNSYITTALGGFAHQVFVWDSSFTALAYAYGWRDWPYAATMDMLYSRQFDGGYLHREHDTRDGLPLLFEPDFSVNPPLLVVAELQFARLSGGLGRLRQVYPVLEQMFTWIYINKRLPDGTFWTTGLANGLDNSPSLGDGYPCLTAQMAHFAECMGEISDLLGNPAEAKGWRAKRDEIGAALNKNLWSEEMKFYSTSLPNGKHNTNKVVTGFWPLWAGVVSSERVECLATHLKDPKSFWRHHPVPSLAADSPKFVPGGDYWLGSTWAPTNCATAKGFQRAGRLDLARELTHRHLDVMSEILTETGEIWENYCSERSVKGSWSGHAYSWSAVGPIALLMEVVLGLEPDAIRHRLRWTPPFNEEVGVKRYALGSATIQLEQKSAENGGKVIVNTDRPFTLELVRNGKTQEVACAAGNTEI